MKEIPMTINTRNQYGEGNSIEIIEELDLTEISTNPQEISMMIIVTMKTIMHTTIIDL